MYFYDALYPYLNDDIITLVSTFLHEDDLEDYTDFIEDIPLAIPTANYNRLRHNKKYKDYLYNICSYTYQKKNGLK